MQAQFLLHVNLKHKARTAVVAVCACFQRRRPLRAACTCVSHTAPHAPDRDSTIWWAGRPGRPLPWAGHSRDAAPRPVLEKPPGHYFTQFPGSVQPHNSRGWGPESCLSRASQTNPMYGRMCSHWPGHPELLLETLARTGLSAHMKCNLL